MTVTMMMTMHGGVFSPHMHQTTTTVAEPAAGESGSPMYRVQFR